MVPFVGVHALYAVTRKIKLLRHERVGTTTITFEKLLDVLN